MTLSKTIKKIIKKIVYSPPIIERELIVNGKTLQAKYDTYNGEFKFWNKEGKPYELNGAGAFSTVNAVLDAFKDVNMRKISYDLNKSDEHLRAKERLYERVLKARGYEEKRFYQKKSIWQHHRTWIKKREKMSAGLEKSIGAISAITLVLSSFLSFSNLTGNVIGNLSQESYNFIGGILFFIGIICAFVYLKIK